MGYKIKTKAEARGLYAQGYSFEEIAQAVGAKNKVIVWNWKENKEPGGLDWDEERQRYITQLNGILKEQIEENLHQFESLYWQTEKLQWEKLLRLLEVWNPSEAVLERTTIGGKKVKVVDEEEERANAVPYDLVKMSDALYKRLRNERGLPGKREELQHKFPDLENLSEEELEAILNATRTRNRETDAGEETGPQPGR